MDLGEDSQFRIQDRTVDLMDQERLLEIHAIGLLSYLSLEVLLEVQILIPDLVLLVQL